MGKKISVDSANMMNKVFEVIEACKLFKFDEKKYRIMIHPQSYVHSIIRFKNGLIKMILYNTDMKIPISNILYETRNTFSDKSNINPKILNKLSFQKVNNKKFPSIKLVNKIMNSGYSAPIIVNASNEILVNLFLFWLFYWVPIWDLELKFLFLLFVAYFQANYLYKLTTSVSPNISAAI